MPRAWLNPAVGIWSRQPADPALREMDRVRQPVFEPYAQLAGYYHRYAGQFAPDYATFLARVSRLRQAEIRSVLDLACGAGTVTAKLATGFPEVVGLDVSGPMLSQARERCSSLPGLTFVHGDFRDFRLGRQFDAVVCASDSLNYVGGPAELAGVFGCVAAHLRAGGLFVFDAITSKGMIGLSGLYFQPRLKGARLAIGFRYNRQARREESVALFTTGIEFHRRVPIGPRVVEQAARDAGLIVEDYFSSSLIPGRWYTSSRCFFLLTRV